MTKNITLALPDDLWLRMEKLGEVNWSAVARESIEKYVAGREGPSVARTPEDEERLLRDQVGLLVRALRTDIVSVKESTVVQLSTFGAKAVPYLKAALAGALREAEEAKSKKLVSYSEERTSDPEGAITGICTVLGMIGDQRAFPELKAALPRPEAVDALAGLRSEEALTTIVESVTEWFRKPDSRYGRDGEYSVSDDFVRRVFSLFGEEGMKRLHEALHKGTDETKQRVSKIVAILGDTGSLAGLRSALENGDYSAKAEAARAIQELKAKDAVPTLVAALFKIREYSLSPKLQPKKGESGSSWEEESRRSKDRDNWRDACESIGKTILQLGSLEDWISVAFHWPRIEQVEDEFNEAVANAGEKAVPSLTRLLQAPEAEVQRSAAEMIAMIKRGEKYQQRHGRY